MLAKVSLDPDCDAGGPGSPAWPRPATRGADSGSWSGPAARRLRARAPPSPLGPASPARKCPLVLRTAHPSCHRSTRDATGSVGAPRPGSTPARGPAPVVRRIQQGRPARHRHPRQITQPGRLSPAAGRFDLALRLGPRHEPHPPDDLGVTRMLRYARERGGSERGSVQRGGFSGGPQGSGNVIRRRHPDRPATD